MKAPKIYFIDFGGKIASVRCLLVCFFSIWVLTSYEKKQRIHKARGIRDAICICQVSCAGALGRVGWSMCVRSVIETVMVLVVCRRIRVFVSDNTEVGVVLTEMKTESEV